MHLKRAAGGSARIALYGAVCAYIISGVAGELSAGAASHERSLGDKALMEGKLNVALKHFESAVKMNPTDHMNWYKRATAYIIDKKYESALKDLSKVLELKPDYAQAFDKRAKIYSSQVLAACRIRSDNHKKKRSDLVCRPFMLVNGK